MIALSSWSVAPPMTSCDARCRRPEALFDRALRVIPGGVNSPVRSFRSVGGEPYFVARGEGAYVWDADGNRLLDYVQSYGASILGHAHPAVVEAVRHAATRGTTFGAPTEGEVLLAEAICARVPGCEQVRLVSSGTEAAMSAVRVARGFTGRDRIVKFAGCYHGHSDGLLAGGGSGVATLGLPDSAGVPAGAVGETVVAPYNRVPELDERVACVIVEAVAANMGLVAPAEGFLAGLRQACDAAGALLIFDEVITGFRLGQAGASGWSGVRPDLWCFGKVIGGGLPIGAFGGRADVLSVLAPDGPVYQAGTLSGNPLATAAGLVVLDALDPPAYAALSGSGGPRSGRRSSDGARRRRWRQAGDDRRRGRRLEARVPGGRAALRSLLRAGGSGTGGRSDYDGAAASAATGLYARLFRSMLDRGVAPRPRPLRGGLSLHGPRGRRVRAHPRRGRLEAVADAWPTGRLITRRPPTPGRLRRLRRPIQRGAAGRGRQVGRMALRCRGGRARVTILATGGR